MTTSPNALTLLATHVAQVSRSTEGSRALYRFARAGLDLAGAADLETVVGQCVPPGGRARRVDVLAHLVPLAPGDPVAAPCALVVLTPELTRLARRLARGPLECEDAASEVVAIGLEVVSRCPGDPRPQMVVDAIWNRARRSTGLRRRGQIDLVTLDPSHDLPRPDVDPLERWPGLLAVAVAKGVITPRQLVIIAQSRMEGRPLTEVAATLGRPYDAVNQERWRAESALRTFALAYARGDST